MKKKEYKTGDVIKLEGERWYNIDRRIAGSKAVIEFTSQLLGGSQAELWSMIKEEYPELFKKHELSYSGNRIIVGEKTAWWKEKNNV